MKKQLTTQALLAICGVLAATCGGFSKGQLKKFLSSCNIIYPQEPTSNGNVHSIGPNKRDWLYNCLVEDLNIYHSESRIYNFIETTLNPISHTREDSRDSYAFILSELNKVLVLLGMEMTKEGKIQEVVAAKTLDEVDRRVNDLDKKLTQRAIHYEVKRYCIKDYLRKDYFDAVFEAAKGLAQRVREKTGLTSDGGELFQKAFSTQDPYLFINKLSTEGELSEFKGIKELLESIFHLVRNPAAHTPKINWKVEETKALDVLTLISFAHKYLDECNPIPGKRG